MYESSMMFTTKLFDIINKMEVSGAAASRASTAAGASTAAAESVPEQTFIVSIPNQQTPLKFTSVKPIELCVYHVRTDGLNPFILFLLHKPSGQNEVKFITLAATIGNTKKIKYASLSYMKTILPAATLTYAGFYETIERNIIILKGTDANEMDMGTGTDAEANEMGTGTDEYIWATAFEIINKKKVMHYLLRPSVLAFFSANTDFLRLRNLDGGIYEAPLVGYYKARQMDTAPEEMDIYRETIIPALGKCYYLHMDLPGYTPKNNIMRIAFFAGAMLIYNGSSIKADTILCREHKRYAIQNYNQHVVL